MSAMANSSFCSGAQEVATQSSTCHHWAKRTAQGTRAFAVARRNMCVGVEGRGRRGGGGGCNTKGRGGLRRHPQPPHTRLCANASRVSHLVQAHHVPHVADPVLHGAQVLRLQRGAHAAAVVVTGHCNNTRATEARSLATCSVRPAGPACQKNEASPRCTAAAEQRAQGLTRMHTHTQCYLHTPAQHTTQIV
jgi:hypothetical protein